MILLVIGILTAIATIISSFSEIKNPDKKGLSAVTPSGWFFYICTIILSVLPTIQNLIQKAIDDNNRIEIAKLQDERDEVLRKRYDTALVTMKSKFDTTTSIVTETLGKYGFRLDSSNKVLISLRDSAKVRVIETDDPVLEIPLGRDENMGIEFIGKISNNEYKFRLEMASYDAGSSFFNIKIYYVTQDSGSTRIWYDNFATREFLSTSERLAKGQISSGYNIINSPFKNISTLYVWVKGAYRKIDGTGNFDVDNLYAYYFELKSTRSIVGETKKEVVSLIKKSTGIK